MLALFCRPFAMASSLLHILLASITVITVAWARILRFSLFAASSLTVYFQSHPVDLPTSHPYYPSPWMNATGEWSDAYAKADAFVRQLTLLEKVNLTTGVGYILIAKRMAQFKTHSLTIFQDWRSTMSRKYWFCSSPKFQWTLHGRHT